MAESPSTTATATATGSTATATPAKQEPVGVYVPEGEGKPIAVFNDADAAARFMRTLPNGDQAIIAPSTGVDAENADVKTRFEELASSVVAPRNAYLDTVAGEMATNARMEATRDLLAEQAKADAEKAAKADVESLTPPATSGSSTTPTSGSSSTTTPTSGSTPS